MDPNHRFPLKDGLGQATIQALQKQSLDASELLRRNLETEIQAQLKASLEAKHKRDLSDIQQQLESEKQQRERERLTTAEAIEKARLEAKKAEAERFRHREEELAQNKQATEAILKELRESLHLKHAAEIKLRRELDDLQAAKETSIAEAVNKARNEMRESLSAQATEQAKVTLEKEKEQWGLQRAQLEKQLQDARASAEDLKRKMEQGSQQTQGEALELTLEAGLRARFPLDTISEVFKGERGADILQTVIAPGGRPCGKIVWETKNTKQWNPKWLEKLREDQLSSKSDLAVLVSITLPNDIKTFDIIDGIWVCSLSSWLALAVALRTQLIALDSARSTSVNRDQKMELLYSYLAGNEFRIRVETMVNTFSAMHQQLQQEKRALTKHWNMRAKQIDAVIDNISGMYGDLQGIMGAQSLPDVQALALDDTDDDK